MKICHISTAHPRYDIRIFHKQCKSLLKLYKDVSLIVADGEGYQEVEGIKIFDIGKNKNRLSRFYNTVNSAKQKAIELNADIYHIHDPELLRISTSLMAYKKIVIYDAHEDLPRQVLSKPYIPYMFRFVLSYFLEKYENYKSKKLNGVVTATPFIKKRFSKINDNTVDINNYPIYTNDYIKLDISKSSKAIAYVGGIFKTRGIFEMLESIVNTDIKLHLAGNFSPHKLEIECKAHQAWKNVVYYGFVQKNEVKEILSKVFVGMVVLQATPSYIVSLPVKMFEYMAAGLPVIASNFPLWKEIVEENNCGICVDPTKPKEITDAINYLYNNPEKAREMGQNGKKIVIEKYNWQIEEQKLFKFYKKISCE